MVEHAFPITIQKIGGFAWQVVIASGRAVQFKNTGPSEKGWRGFKNHHSKEITSHK